MEFKNGSIGILLMVGSFAVMSICSTIVFMDEESNYLLNSMIAISAMTMSVGIYYYRKYTQSLYVHFRRLDQYDAVFAKSSMESLKKFNEAYSQFQNLNNSFSKLISNYKSNDDTYTSFLHTVLDRVNAGIIIASLNGEVDYINNAALKLIGIESLNALQEVHEINTELAKHLNQYEDGKQELVKVNLNNEIKKFSLHHAEVQFSGSTKHLITIKNIESELAQSEMESWQKLIKVITHEIMNSLTPIVTLSKAIGEDLDTEDLNENKEDIKEGLDVITNRSEGLLGFVENYRSLTHIPTPKFELIPISALFERIQGLLSPKFSDHRVNFEIIYPTEDFKIMADKSMLEQVLINLVVNAIDATSETVNPIIKLEAKLTDDYKSITVMDNGSGIPENILDKIFVPFYTSKEKGSGIGLALCKYIMMLHKGNILVNSKPTRTVFELKF